MQGAGLDADRRGAAGGAVDEGELAEDLACPHARDGQVADADLDRARLHHETRLAGVPLAEDGLAVAHAARPQRAQHIGQVVARQVGEERNRGEKRLEGMRSGRHGRE